MTALDTNVLVRIITNTIGLRRLAPQRFYVSRSWFFIPKTVVLEFEWVLRRAYRIGPIAIVSALRDVMTVFNAEIEDEAAVRQAIEWYEKGMVFADGLHVASAGRDRKFATFDNALRRKFRGLGVGKLAEI